MKRRVGKIEVELRPSGRDDREFVAILSGGGVRHLIEVDVPTYIRQQYPAPRGDDFLDVVAEAAVLKVVTSGGPMGAWAETLVGNLEVERRDPKRNPSERGKAAVKMYRTFHQNDPKRVFESARFRFPERVRRGGPALEVLYRSDKRDPETGEQPRKPIDYIHEHDNGVIAYRTDGRADTDVPDFIARAEGLVLLGECLGFAYEDDETGQEVEGQVRSPLPKLYTIPSGKALIVIQGTSSVLAMMWGGRLGVEARGIVH